MAGRRHAAEKNAEVPLEFFFRRAPLAGFPSRLGRLADDVDRAPQHFAVQALFAVEVVRDQLLVDAGPRGDLPDARPSKALVAELDQCGLEDALTGAFRIVQAFALVWG